MEDLEATILSQYANSPTIVQLITNMNAYLDPAANINQFYDDIWNIDTAEGYGLDVWGRIVGVSRTLQVSSFSYFGFQGPSSASGAPWNQGIFYNGESTTMSFKLSDNVYRTLILAKALANISNATIPSINQILINLFGPNGLLPVEGNSYCTDNGGMAMTYTFGSALTPLQASIVFQSGVLLKPCGVTLTVLVNGNGLVNDGGVLQLTIPTGWPLYSSGPPVGAMCSNGGVVSAYPGATLNPLAPPVFLATTTSAALLLLNGGLFPWAAPTAGSGQLWIPGGAAGGDIWVA